MDYLICKVINGREGTVFSPNHSIIAYRALYHKGKTKKIKEIRENAGAAQPGDTPGSGGRSEQEA